MSRQTVPTLFFDELNVGDEWESSARTITQPDIINFAGVSGDFNPIHVDHVAAAAGPFGQPVAHGLLVFSIASGLAIHAPRVHTIAFLTIEHWVFHRPVVPGDTIRVLTRVEEIEPRARRRRAQVAWSRRILNQRDTVVQEGLIRTLVQGRSNLGQDGPGDPRE